MQTFHTSFSDRYYCKKNVLFLAFSWTAGLLAGFLCAYSLRSSLFPLMHLAVSIPVSIVCLLCASFFPFLFSSIAVYISIPALIYLLSFIKAILYSFHICACLIAFGSSGWLVHYLITFSDTFVNLILMRFWLVSILHYIRIPKVSILGTGLSILCICFLDYYIIAPYLNGFFL